MTKQLGTILIIKSKRTHKCVRTSSRICFAYSFVWERCNSFNASIKILNECQRIIKNIQRTAKAIIYFIFNAQANQVDTPWPAPWVNFSLDTEFLHTEVREFLIVVEWSNHQNILLWEWSQSIHENSRYWALIRI